MKCKLISIIFVMLLALPMVFAGISLVLEDAPAIATNVNSSEFWDNLDSPLEINIGDLVGISGYISFWNRSNFVVYPSNVSNNVSIGTSSSTHKLNVVGDSNFTENATFEKDVIIQGTLFGGSPVKIDGINISNNLFMLEENRNSSSRFTLENLNGGSNATAVISAINNFGGTMSIGIGSSNFMIGLKNYQNVTALFSKSRGDMVFVNFFKEIFIWLYNPSDDGDPNNLVELMRLDEKGLNVSGNITGNQIYAEIWGGDIGDVSLVEDVYSNITNITNSKLNGFSYDNNHTLTAQVGGMYSVNSQFAFSGSANQEYHLAFAVNGARVQNCHTERVIGTGGDVGSASITCLCPMNIGDFLNIQVENVDSGGDPTIHNVNLNLVRIGD